MRKSTMIFIYLLLVVLLIFFIFRIFGDKFYCGLKGGKIYVSSSYVDAERTCKLEHSDVGKKCSDNNDCKGYCLINNRVYLKEKFLELQEDKRSSEYFGKVNIDEFNIDEFKREAKIETNIEGYCGSRFSYWSNEPEVVIKNGVISLGGRWGTTGYFE